MRDRYDCPLTTVELEVGEALVLYWQTYPNGFCPICSARLDMYDRPDVNEVKITDLGDGAILWDAQGQKVDLLADATRVECPRCEFAQEERHGTWHTME